MAQGSNPVVLAINKEARRDIRIEKGEKAYCLSCGYEFSSDEALISWLNGKSPNPLSYPSCGELIPGLRWKSSRKDDKRIKRY